MDIETIRRRVQTGNFPGSKVFCGFTHVHRINPVSGIKNLLKQVEKPILTRFSVFFLADDEFIHRHFNKPQKKRELVISL